MNEKPKVSVIMPSLNVESYIRQCMESVMNQTLKDIEIICVDAGSDDGTLEILREYAENDDRICLLHSDKRSYGYQVNIGFDAATADYVGIVETDDYIIPEMYEELYSAAEKADFPDVVKGGYFAVWPEDDGNTYTITPVCRINEKTGTVFRLTERYEMIGGHPSIWAAIYRKEFLVNHHIRVKEVPGGGWVDNPFLFQTMCEADRICWVNRPLYYYRRSNPKASHTNKNASSFMKDCSIPMARVNDIKDYLDHNYPDDRQLERHLFIKLLSYVDRMTISPYCTDEDRRSIVRTIKRFRPSIAANLLLRRYYKKCRSALSRQFHKVKKKDTTE